MKYEQLLDLLDSLETLHGELLLAEEEAFGFEAGEDIMARIGQYLEICEQQTQICLATLEDIRNEDWSQVERNIKLIDGLAELVKDDIQFSVCQESQDLYRRA